VAASRRLKCAPPPILPTVFGSGELRTTNMQNLLIVNVPRANVDALVRELDAAGLPVAASAFRRGAIACTGTELLLQPKLRLSC
jgi:sulfite reductase beta subunit-like hemoprotein